MKKTFLKTVGFYFFIAIGALIAFIWFELTGFNLNFSGNDQNKKIIRKDNVQKTYSCDITGLSLITIDTNNTNVNVVPSKSNELEVIYFENSDEKYNILKTQNGISIIYKNYNPPKGTLLQRTPIVKGGNPSRYEDNDLIIAVPEVYHGDIDFFSKRGESWNWKPFLFNGPFKINGLKNLNNLNIDFDNLLTIENVSCKNNINIKTDLDCDLTNVFSERSIKINTVLGEVNLDNVSSKNILYVKSHDGPININKIYSDRIYLRSTIKISGTVYGKESDYVIKNKWEYGIEIPTVENPENKKILIVNRYSDIKFTV